MSLDSSNVFSKVAEDKLLSDRYSYLSEGREHTQSNWVFLFTHRTKLDITNDRLNDRFETFVHKTIVYQRRGKGKVVKKELPTISGLIFIHGAADDVQQYLDDTLPGLRLVKNYGTHTIAEISNQEMAAFMRLSTLGEGAVRFMLNPTEYYSNGHQLIRITSGDLKGCEGYIVRLHRDRKLITQIGNMTVAIGGITKESFENAEECVKIRRDLTDGYEVDNGLSPTEQEIARYFFTPSNDLEAMAIAKNLDSLISKFRKELHSGNVTDAADGIVFTLSEIAGRFAPGYFKSLSVGINDICIDLVKILKDAIDSQVIVGTTKDKVLIGLESIMLRYPVIPIDEIINAAD